MHSTSKQIICGGALAIIGVMLIIGGYFAHYSWTGDLEDYELKSNLVVDSINSKGYYDWEEGYALNNPNYNIFYLWNITNLDDVLNGRPPKYSQVGPYYYRYYWYNRNASFSPDGNSVSFNLVEDYVFVPDMSSGDPTVDLITNLSPAFVGIMQNLPSDAALLIVATPVVIGEFVDFFLGEFIELVKSQQTPSNLGTRKDHVVNYISTQLNMSLSDAENAFYYYWANATSVPPVLSNWSELLLCNSNNQSTNLSLDTTSKLFDPNFGLSLVDTSPEAVVVWLRAFNNQTGPEAQSLISTFGLSESQLNIILTWRNSSYITTYVVPEIMSQIWNWYPGANITYVGWIQLISANFTGGQSFSDIYSEWYPQFNSPMEFYPFLNISVDQANDFLFGNYGLLENIQNIQVFMAASNYSDWGLSDDEGSDALNYIGSIFNSYSIPIISDLFNEGSGLIVTQTADYWIWNCQDPLLTFLLGAANASCGLQSNDSIQNVSQIWTGKDDLSKINQYILWRNQTEVYYWNEPVPVSGATDSGQFSPYITQGQSLYVWDESFIKTIKFNQGDTTSVSGIDTYIYTLDASAFAASELYTNTINGFANETASSAGVPIFLSNWDFYGVDSKYNYSGMRPNASDVTTLYVEPVTGNAIKADEKLQLNLYYTPGSQAFWQNFNQWINISDDQFFPLLKAWQQSLIGSDDASEMKYLLFFLSNPFQMGVLWGSVSVGACLLLVGSTVVGRGIIKRRSLTGYTTIQ